ncbi:DNA methyltransferase [Acetomicrobium sp.]|uniref:DNA methyltransferase n=1 Tax=Acetomicrobium sp. TaxID=1872099 RepID=UPI002B261C16|nr:DNA methyltransferase [Acetomicrobium sp.]HOQ17855.1 DNA methyltransferase [Defluviitaleaceae bacterium]HPT77426.1 DNA methyltransferase [Defluviitaleaceae bacterium]
MQVSDYYPISLDEIEAKVLKKLKRNWMQKCEDVEPLDNVKEITNDFGEKIIRVDGEIPVDLPINNGDRFLFISYDQSSLTHGLHKYPAKFFPELPRWLIKRYSKDKDLVIDPFMGSATTNVEALLARRHSVGIDISPFSRFLAKVKVTPINEQELERCKKGMLRLLVNYRPEKVANEDIPTFPYRDNWFNKEIILELAYIKKCIENLDTSEDIKDFFKICFSSIIRSVSNADDNCTRTVIRKKLKKTVNPSDALRRFAEVILTNIPKMIEFSNLCPKNISVTFPEDMDARNIKYENETFDLALTSPPYANAVDYPRMHQLETYWLGFAKGSLATLKKKQVGTESVTAKKYKDLHLTGIKEADKVITRIYNKDPRRAYIAYKYLMDMETNLKEIYRVLKSNGKYVIVVGNNKIRGEVFENWKYIISMAENIGFVLENYFASEIIKHFIKVPREERIDTDWILVLTKR